MESVHDDSEIDESKTDENDDDEEEMNTPIQDTLGNPYKIRN